MSVAVLPLARGTRGRSVWIAWAVLGFIALSALWPGLLAIHSPLQVNPTHALEGPSAAHLLGTDQLGRDLYSRVIHGAGQSLTVGLGATVVAVVIGCLFGTLAAGSKKAGDEVIMRTVDVFLAFPGLLLALLVVAILGPSTTNATLALAASMIPGFIRLARGQALVVRRSDYVKAAVVLGTRPVVVYMRHVVPNALPSLLVLATVNIGTAIIAGSSLSFLGLGAQAPSPEWGAMLSDARDYLDVAWSLALVPGLAITVTVIAVNVVGRDLMRRFEGRHPGVHR
ncbi:ABC transporter permease [Actinocrispum wychmicini]|uniref:Peptide/nickel transport system permease protein n=1 Tax=Actinocrispum wychmicini TaxID=1213861 RepID=A0A4V6NP08_9PSEU|nr:ABC transporter permease [Actinocrispum wychmicini]TCO62320.1 peptide/nickel transport system permease protein [Actinocrispum wychmicini]